MPTLKVCLFGSPTITRDDILLSIVSQKAQALFYFLISHRQPHSREKLATLFWGETSDRQAKASLRNTLYELRRDLSSGSGTAQECILAESNTLCFNPEADYWLDVEEFEKLLDKDAPDERARMDNYARAVELVRGDFLEGFSEYFRVIVAYGSYYRNIGFENVCGIQPSAQSDFENRVVRFFSQKQKKSHYR